ncbi:MAG TPA: hypothetical protein VN841_15610 [Bryobacteraceae bacterium]|nr:hypothetical protein [Bryobacteraceae bacterium]
MARMSACSTLLPALSGEPIRVEIRRSLGAHLAATSIPGRVILLDREVLARPGEFERILVHEVFHFVWVRLGNPLRRGWEGVLEREFLQRARGELGWSAEWRKCKLSAGAPRSRTPAWRRYVCESFCDSAAWMFAGLTRHGEFTLPWRFRRGRRAWFERNFGAGPVRI